MPLNIYGSSGIISATLIANLPQVIITFLYFMYNGLFTCMLLSHEWKSYVRERKYLRVSSPKGKQRSTYWLQLPYRYSIPLLIIAALLHWIVSQSIFLVHLEGLDVNGDPDPYLTLSTCGYSFIPMITAILLGTLAVLLSLVTAFFGKYSAGMPLPTNYSAAISAACHPPEMDMHASTKAVKFGQLLEDDIKVFHEVDHGRCCFTSFDVKVPVCAGPKEWYDEWRVARLAEKFSRKIGVPKEWILFARKDVRGRGE